MNESQSEQSFPQQPYKYISVELDDVETTFTIPFTFSLDKIISTSRMNFQNSDETLPMMNDVNKTPKKQLLNESCKNDEKSVDLKNDTEIGKPDDDEMTHELDNQNNDENTSAINDFSNTSFEMNKGNGILSESVYRYMTSLMRTPPPDIVIISKDEMGQIQSSIEENAASSEVGTDSFVDAQEELLDQTLTDHCEDEDHDEKDFELVSTPTSKSPDHTISNNRLSLNIDQLNVSPCCTLSNNGTVTKSPSLLAQISADDQECSFSYEDRLELLETKITYEKKIVELYERLDQQKEAISEQVSKVHIEQIDHIRKEYDVQCQKSRDEVDNLRAQQQILQDKLELQKTRYETVVGELEETMEQLRMDNSSMKNQYETTAFIQINDLKQRHEQLSIQLYESQNENQILNNAMLEMDKDRHDLRETIQSLNSNIIELNHRLVESVHDREILTVRLNETLAQKSTFENEFQSKLTEAKQKINSLELIANESESKMESLVSDHLEELNKLKLENDETITKLQNEINNLNSTLESNLFNLKNLNDEFVQKNNELEKNLQEMSKQNKKILEIETSLKLIQCENEKLKLNDQKIVQFETKIHDLETKLSKLKNENDSLKQDVQVSLTREQNHKVKLANSKSEISKLMAVNQELLDAKIELEEARSNIESRLFDCEERNILLETKLEQVEQSEVIHRDLQKLYDDFQAKHAQCDQIGDENQRLHNEMEQLRKQNKELFEKFEQSRHEWTESRTKLLDNNDRLLQSNDTMAGKIVELNDMVQNLTKKNASLDSELKSGHEQLKRKFDETCQRLVETERAKFELETKISTIMAKHEKMADEFKKAEKQFSEER